MNNQRREPSVVAKHKLVVADDGKRHVHLCDVTSWDDSKQVEHGISGKLEVTTRRYTPSKLIKHLPRFRLTLSPRADAARLVPFLDRLRKDKQVRVRHCTLVITARGNFNFAELLYYFDTTGTAVAVIFLASRTTAVT